MRAQRARGGERARERRMQHGQAVGAQESGDRARGGCPRHRESADASVCLAAAAGESVTTGSPRTLATCRLSVRAAGGGDAAKWARRSLPTFGQESRVALFGLPCSLTCGSIVQ